MNNWADYVKGPFKDWRDLTILNDGIFRCPQGMKEIKFDIDDTPVLSE